MKQICTFALTALMLAAGLGGAFAADPIASGLPIIESKGQLLVPVRPICEWAGFEFRLPYTGTQATLKAPDGTEMKLPDIGLLRGDETIEGCSWTSVDLIDYVPVRMFCKLIGAECRIDWAARMIEIAYGDKRGLIPLPKSLDRKAYVFQGVTFVPVCVIADWMGAVERIESYRGLSYEPAGKEKMTYAQLQEALKDIPMVDKRRLVLTRPAPRVSFDVNITTECSLDVFVVANGDSPGWDQKGLVVIDGISYTRLSEMPRELIESSGSKAGDTVVLKLPGSTDTLNLPVTATKPATVIAITHPESVQRSDNRWEWSTEFKISSGSGTYKITGSGSIEGRQGSKWVDMGSDHITRESVTLEPGKKCSGDYWCAEATRKLHKMCGAHAKFTWTGADARTGRSFTYTEDVFLKHSACLDGLTAPEPTPSDYQE